MAVVEVRIVFKGNVQGVFLRSHIKKFADSLNVNGVVKNLENGNVEMLAQGDEKTIQKLIELILKKPGFGDIKEVEKKTYIPTKIFEDFQIIR